MHKHPATTSNLHASPDAWKTVDDWISTRVYQLVRDFVHQLCLSGCFEILHRLNMADNNKYSLVHCVYFIYAS